MKKLLALLFTLALALSLAAPVFAQDSSAPAQTDSSMKKSDKKMKKKSHMKKAKKMKKDKMEKPAESTTPPPQ